jgi:DNA-binding response OmpR family regulator
VKILVIEDEKSLAESIKAYFSKEGYICELANNYDTANMKIHVYQYDCILVDISLPDGNGLNLINELKALQSHAGIIIISARDSLDDRIKGLNIGSDDYLTKPFHLSELNARLKAVIRRKFFDGQIEFQIQELKIIPDEHLAFIYDNQLSLTKKEYDLLYYFMSNINRVITKESIAEYLWGDDMDMADSFDFVYAHIKNLRKKMTAFSGKDYIETVYGIGYKFRLS